MNFPLYMKDVFSYPTGLVLITIVGFFFGFVLERSGFGQATKIAEQFYFTNMRVLKVMFSAITTALLGLVILSAVGLVDIAAITVPQAFLWPQIVGGLLLGAGFVISGYCPGTAMVASGSGNQDGMVAIVGMVVGSLLFGPFYPLLENFYLSTPLEGLRFPQLLGIDQAIIAIGVLFMAIGAFIGAEKIENMMAKKNDTSPPRSSVQTRNKAFVVLGLLGVIALATLGYKASSSKKAVAKKEPTEINSMELAKKVITQPSSFYLIDLRDSKKCQKKTIPGAVCLPDEDPSGSFIADLPPSRKLILFSDKDISKTPEPVANFTGEVSFLKGGFEDFEKNILSQPIPPSESTKALIEKYNLQYALYNHFTGTKIAHKPMTIKPKKVKRSIKKGGGC